MTELLLMTVCGGIVGAVFMDLAEWLAARWGITSGVNVALIGRWVTALLQGRFQHKDIRSSRAHPKEVAIGWLFHLFIAGGGVALLLPVAWSYGKWPVAVTEPMPYILFGLITSVLPWFLLLPSFGWGLWGRRGPQGSNALLAAILSHIPYGLGLWLTMLLFCNFTQSIRYCHVTG